MLAEVDFFSVLCVKGYEFDVFQIFNPHLMRDLVELGLWDDEMRFDVILNKGSVQKIERIPPEIRELYKTVWEISQRVGSL